MALHLPLSGEVRPPDHRRSALYNTDGQIFSDAGVPVVLFMENYDINRQGYHDTHDTMENIDLDYGAVHTIAIERWPGPRGGSRVNVAGFSPEGARYDSPGVTSTKRLSLFSCFRKARPFGATIVVGVGPRAGPSLLHTSPGPHPARPDGEQG